MNEFPWVVCPEPVDGKVGSQDKTSPGSKVPLKRLHPFLSPKFLHAFNLEPRDCCPAAPPGGPGNHRRPLQRPPGRTQCQSTLCFHSDSRTYKALPGTGKTDASQGGHWEARWGSCVRGGRSLVRTHGRGATACGGSFRRSGQVPTGP